MSLRTKWQCSFRSVVKCSKCPDSDGILGCYAEVIHGSFRQPCCFEFFHFRAGFTRFGPHCTISFAFFDDVSGDRCATIWFRSFPGQDHIFLVAIGNLQVNWSRGLVYRGNIEMTDCTKTKEALMYGHTSTGYQRLIGSDVTLAQCPFFNVNKPSNINWSNNE